MLGVVLAVISSITFSLNAVMARRGLARATASAGAFVTVILGVPLFFGASLVTGQLFNAPDVPLRGYVLLSAAGVLHFGVGRYFNYRAASSIGATRAASVQALTVPYAILIAFLFLGETISPIMGFGIVLIIIGPAIMVQRRSKPEAKAPPPPSGGSTSGEPVAEASAFQLRQVEGYLSAFATIGAYGTSPILIRAALSDLEGVAIFGGLVAYSAAAGVLLLTLVHPARRGLITAMRPSTVRLFLGAGTFVFLAQMFRFMALSVAPVAVVTPLQRTGAVFTLIFSWTLNRHLEVINLRVVAGILLSVTGAVLLAVFGS
jgi:drug/metabolite transporter (DMT)-like permease